MEDEIKEILQMYNFTFELTEEQVSAIDGIMAGRDTFVTLPTGHGKSMCYILPPLLSTKRTGHQKTALVVTPLKSIMMEQRAKLAEKGIKVAMLVQQKEMIEGDKEAILSGKIDIILTSPEAALSWFKTLTGELLQGQICVLAFDECHCISEWGLDFRKSYRDVGPLASIINAPMLCLTATITSKIFSDVTKVLKLRDTKIVKVLPDRPNIHLHVLRPKTNQKETELAWLLNLIKLKQNMCPKMVVFLPTIKQASDFYVWAEDELDAAMYRNGSFLREDRLVEMFHAGMEQSVKDRVMSDFGCVGGNLRVLFATLAFGMGVSVSDIEVVIHWGVPKTSLALWQEIGRAARNGGKGLSIIYRTGYTLGKCEKSVKDIFNAPCVRKEILSNFIIDSSQQLPIPDPCDLSCTHYPCCCGLCKCCSGCFSTCKCKFKKDPISCLDGHD